MVLTRIIVETLKPRVWKQLITPVSFFFFFEKHCGCPVGPVRCS